MKWIYSDGGRKEAKYKGSTGDCACRAIAIITGLTYQMVYNSLNVAAMCERTGKRKCGKSNARLGMYKNTVRKYLLALGMKWTPTMAIGSGCKVHLKTDELPQGKLIVCVSKHYTAVIDGVIYDTFNPSRDETRCVYGYYSL